MWRVKKKKKKNKTIQTVPVGSVGEGNVTLGSATLGTTTINSLTTNISTTGAATVNLGNTGTTVTAGSIVNIGRGSTGINIGNSATLFNVIGKVRLSSTPLLVYAFSSSIPTSQNIASPTSDPIIKWPTSGGNVTNYSSSTGITYSNTTGIFTNSNTYPIIVMVNLTVGYTFSTVGARVAWIQYSDAGSILGNKRIAVTNVGCGPDYNTLTTGATFMVSSGDGFFANTYQNSGGTLTIGGSIQDTSPTRISILVL